MRPVPKERAAVRPYSRLAGAGAGGYREKTARFFGDDMQRVSMCRDASNPQPLLTSEHSRNDIILTGIMSGLSASAARGPSRDRNASERPAVRRRRVCMELGLFTFGDLDPEGRSGLSQAERTRAVIEECVLAEQVGLDVFGVGEHHRKDFIVSAPAVVLAAAAARTNRIRLTSAVTVLSSDDPVRVYQAYATIDQISNGRAEVMAGRGSFIESFPLFGYDLDDYDELFTEKLDLLLAIRERETVTWSGRLRPPIRNLGVYPRAVQNPLPVWVAVGGSPESAVRVGTLGLPMALAIIGGTAERFKPFIELYRKSAAKAGHAPGKTRLAISAHGYITKNSQDAAEEMFPSWVAMFSTIGRERGWPPVTRAQYDAGRTLHGHLFTGSPQEVIDKIMYQHEMFGHDRFLMQIALGDLPHKKVLESIELFGTRVAPVVRKETA
jgi:probable LLM family oxidoreductase